MHKVYKLTRTSDGQIYIGIAQNLRTRLNSHKISDRFINDSFKCEVLYEDSNRDVVCDKEEYYINLYDSFNNGLNNTKGGKAHGHNSKKFTILGYKFSDDSKRKMSESAKARAKREGHKYRKALVEKAWNNGGEELRKRQSAARKGRILSSKLSVSDYKDIRNGLRNFLTNNMIDVISRNGRKLSRERMYARSIHTKYGVTEAAIWNILQKRTLR